MSLLAIISALAALLASVGVTERFPEYGARVYRARRTFFQQGPVRTSRLIFTDPPREADPTVLQMRVLALVAWVGAAAALAFWALS